MYQLNMPVKMYYGRNIWKEALSKLESVLHGTVMIVTTGRSLIRLGYLDELKKYLEVKNEINKIVVFDTVSANPRISEVQMGIDMAQKEKADVIIGFGGGSAMDAAKAVAAGISTGSIEDFFYGGKEVLYSAVPVVAIPTTAGTGSELSKAAILTDEAKKIKSGVRGNGMYPVAAVVDSMFTESVPVEVTMETGFDVFAHAAESYFSKAATPYTEMLSEYVIQIVGRELPCLFADPGNIEAREKMSYASMIMGINLANTGTCLPHRMQYPLGAHTNTSHGAGLAALYPAWIDHAYNYDPEKMERIMGFLTGTEICGRKRCVETMQEFLTSLGLPVSICEFGIQRENLSGLASQVTGNIQNDPAGVEADIILKIYESAWR